MAQLRKSHPWNPGYAIPQNVRDEPFGQGVVTTAYSPRGTISMLQPDWLTEGAALEVAAKVDARAMSGLGDSIFSSKKRAGNGSLGCTSLSGSSLAGSSLGDGGLFGPQTAQPQRIEIGGHSDPIANFGRDGARAVISQMKTVPASMRAEAMRALFDAIDPKLWDLVAAKTEKFQATKKYTPALALEKALAATLSNRLVDQFAKIAQTQQMPVGGLLGMIDPAQRVEALSGFWSNLGDKLKSVGSSIVGAAKGAANALGNLACKTVGNPATAQVAGAIPSPQSQAIAAGANIAQGLCGNAPNAGAVAAGIQQPAYQSTSSFPILPVAIVGGAALIAIVVLAKK